VDSAADVAGLMAAELGWDAVRRRREVGHYVARVEAERESQTMPDDLSADAARLGALDVRAVPAGPRIDPPGPPLRTRGSQASPR
jgi:glycerol-3-phosphate dehydrogenase